MTSIPDGTIARATDTVHVKIIRTETRPRDTRTWALVDKMRPMADGSWYFFGVPEWMALTDITFCTR